MATLLNGRALSKAIQERLRAELAPHLQAGVRAPGLALILVGEDEASKVYVRNKGLACDRVGLAHTDHRLPAHTQISELLDLIAQLNADAAVDGILVQLPLPDALKAYEQQVIEAISPSKDVDCFHPENVGRLSLGTPRFMPATPGGIVSMLDTHGIDVCGMEAVVIGRSNIVGKPMAQLLTSRNATVTLCHSRTRGVEAHVRRADLVIAAIGKPRYVPGDWIKPGAIVIDVGINRTDEGLVGDVDFETAEPRAAFITPVPGGVGPTTIATLLENTVRAWRRAAL